jgi:hypothetical protein
MKAFPVLGHTSSKRWSLQVSQMAKESVCENARALAVEPWVQTFHDGRTKHLRSIQIENPLL